MRQILPTSGQVGEILRARRKARRLSQQALAAKLDISQERLSRLETDPGALTLDRLLALANLLGLELVVRDRAKTQSSNVEW
jgi:HTH-type transcriptional regulator / antitoxin HipB